MIQAKNMFAKLFDKINNKHFLSLAGNGVMAGLAMLTLAILFRVLTKVDIGYWFFYQTLFVLLDTFRSGFLQMALISFYSGTEETTSKKVIGSIWYIAIIITFLFAGINLIVYPFSKFFNDPAIILTIKWFGITFLATLPSNIASWIMQADQRFDRLLILRVLNQGSFIIGVLTCVFFNTINLQNLFLLNFVVNVIGSVVAIILGWSKINWFVFRTSEYVKKIYNYGKYSVGASVSTSLLRSSDTFIITYLLGPSALAIYNIPVRLMELIEIPLRSMVSTGMASIAKAYNRNNLKEVGYILQKYAGTLSVAFIPIALVAISLADVGVGLLGGGKYLGTEAANFYRISMIFAIFYSIDRFIGVSLDVIQQPRINFIKVLLMSLMNIVGDFAGILIFGNIYGVALGTLFPLCIGIFFGYHHLRKHVNFKLSNVFIFGYIQVRRILRKNIQYFKK